MGGYGYAAAITLLAFWAAFEICLRDFRRDPPPDPFRMDRFSKGEPPDPDEAP